MITMVSCLEPMRRLDTLNKRNTPTDTNQIDLQMLDDSFSSTNSSRSTSTVQQAAALNDPQSNDDEPAMMRPVRTGRAKATSYVSVFVKCLALYISSCDKKETTTTYFSCYNNIVERATVEFQNASRWNNDRSERQGRTNFNRWPVRKADHRFGWYDCGRCRKWNSTSCSYQKGKEFQRKDSGQGECERLNKIIIGSTARIEEKSVWRFEWFIRNCSTWKQSDYWIVWRWKC